MPRPYVVYHWRDNNDGRAEVRLYPPDVSSYTAIASFALAMAVVLQAVSDARLVRFEVVHIFEVEGSPAPAPESDVRSYGLLFYRNGVNVSSILVPSVSELLTETDGPFAGVRITRSRLDVLGLLPAFDALVAGALDPLGRPYGNSFSVGGRVVL